MCCQIFEIIETHLALNESAEPEPIRQHSTVRGAYQWNVMKLILLWKN